MVTQEMAQAIMRERMREFAALDLEQRARTLQRRTDRPRSGPSRGKQKRPSLLSFMSRALHMASV